MLQKLITKYGLAAHLAMLAAGSSVLPLFMGGAALATAVTWMSAFALTWLMCEPSLRSGERSSHARWRVRNDMVRDPLFYFLLFAAAMAAVRWFNSGLEQVYDIEQGVWQIKRAGADILPSAVGDKGYVWFAMALATFTVTMGLRHALGMGARIFFGLASGLFSAAAGITAVTMAALGNDAFLKMAAQGFDAAPAGFVFGTMLAVTVACGADAEARKWKKARVPYALAVAGNAAGLMLLTPPLVAAAFLGLTLVLFIFGLVYIRRVGSAGGVAQSFALFALGAAAGIFALATFLPETLIELKMRNLDAELALPETYYRVSAALSDLAKRIWMEHPWSGAGIGGFEVTAPFAAVAEDWETIPPAPASTINGFWMLLVERGLVGCIVLAAGMAMMLAFYFARMIGAHKYLRKDDDSEILLFAVSPAAWAAIPLLLLQLATAWFTPVTAASQTLTIMIAPLALATASFPRDRRKPEAAAAK